MSPAEICLLALGIMCYATGMWSLHDATKIIQRARALNDDTHRTLDEIRRELEEYPR